MKLKFTFVPGLLAFLALGALVQAKDEVADPHWLSTDEIGGIIAAEPPPPAPGSDADKADLQTEINVQNSRTDALSNEAKTDEHYSLALFDKVIGFSITRDTHPVTLLFLEQVNKEAGVLIVKSKDKWQRKRPYEGHPDQIHALFPAGGFSYPSGHSTASYVDALVLGQLFPDKAQALLDRADAIAQSRVTAGVHYTTDIKEGETLAHELVKDLLAKPAFQAALNAAKAELAAKP